jgi:hypothetical protein
LGSKNSLTYVYNLDWKKGKGKGRIEWKKPGFEQDEIKEIFRKGFNKDCNWTV